MIYNGHLSHRLLNILKQFENLACVEVHKGKKNAGPIPWYAPHWKHYLADEIKDHDKLEGLDFRIEKVWDFVEDFGYWNS